MFCIQCGKELVEDARFCPECGAATDVEPLPESALSGSPADLSSSEVNAFAAASPDEPIASVPQASPSAGVPPDDSVGLPQDFGQVTEEIRISPPGSKEPGARRKRTAIVAAVAGVVAVALVAVGVYFLMQNRAYEEAHRTSLVSLVFNLPDYGTEKGSGVPVSVEGVDLDGNSVSETFVASAAGDQVELKRGAYTARVIGSPVNETGRIYHFPSEPTKITIDEGGTQVESSAGQTQDVPNYLFEIVPPENVTDEEIEAIRIWMTDLGLDGNLISQTVERVVDARQAELDRIAEEQRKAEEEARRKAEEEARQRAEALRSEAFADFPTRFMFSAGVGNWRTIINVAADGTFTGSWYDGDLGMTGPGYPNGTENVCDFEGKFTVLEKASATDYVMQIDYLRATKPAGESIEGGRRVLRVDDTAYGLGRMTETSVGGWHLYKPGQSTSTISEHALMWLLTDSDYKKGDSTLTNMSLCNDESGWGKMRD